MKIILKRMMSLLLCFMLIISVSACQKNETASLYNEGTYTASAVGKNGPIDVEVVFSADKIESVTVNSQSETEGISDGALEIIPEKIVSEQSLAVDVVSGASLSSKAVLTAVEDCVVQAGGNVNALKEKVVSDKPASVEELDYDIVVVGAGAAGTAAALAASEQSQHVLLLEKTASPMGAGTLAGGLFAAESDLQKDAGKTVSKEWLYDQYLHSSSGYMNSLLVRTIIDESSETVNWLIENGCKLNLVDAGTGASYEHIGMPTTLHGYDEGGTVAITKLIESFKNNGGTVMFSTPATDLLKDANGKVVGVTARKADGTELKINAKAVVLATGGYGGNEEMLRKYLGANYTFGEISSNKGDGIQMAWKAGADELGIGSTQYFWQTFSPESFGNLIETLGDDWFGLTAFTFYPHLRVNALGQRFSDETTVSNFAIHGAQIHMQPQQIEYLVLDSSVLDQIATEGYVSIEDHYGIWEGNRQFYMEFNEPNDTDTLMKAERTPTDYRPLLDAALDTGVVFKADSLEALAKKIDVDSNTFVNSVSQYNHAIETGHDELFFSDVSRLIPVQSGPYYAIKFTARNLTTLGGVKINEKIQAVDENSMPIEGLYVAGADAGGMYGMSYVDFEGGTLGFAYTSGRLAGENAAAMVNGK